jgi:hypothetical protein
VDDELDPFGGDHADFETSRGVVGADEHGQIIDFEHTDRVAVGVKDVVVGSPCLRALSRMTGSTVSSYLDVGWLATSAR